MDINEIDLPMRYRHPWERSRTRCLLWELRPLLEAAGGNGEFIDLGAGDQYFDDALLDAYPGLRPVAVDVGYTEAALQKVRERLRHPEKIRTARSLAELAGTQAEFALMMDSLEYMEDDAACLRALASLIKPGGRVILTLPAYRLLFSEFDRIVRGMRRYNKKDVRRVLADVPALRIERMHCFYTSLFLVRLLQKISHAKIDPEHKVISGWAHGDRSVLTKTVMGVLGLDYRLNALLGRAGLDLPGLSLLVICRKTQAGEDA